MNVIRYIASKPPVSPEKLGGLLDFLLMDEI
jgi:hypothetical protein